MNLTIEQQNNLFYAVLHSNVSCIESLRSNCLSTTPSTSSLTGKSAVEICEEILECKEFIGHLCRLFGAVFECLQEFYEILKVSPDASSIFNISQELRSAFQSEDLSNYSPLFKPVMVFLLHQLLSRFEERFCPVTTNDEIWLALAEKLFGHKVNETFTSEGYEEEPFAEEDVRGFVKCPNFDINCDKEAGLLLLPDTPTGSCSTCDHYTKIAEGRRLFLETSGIVPERFLGTPYGIFSMCNQ